jgi:6-phosphogluconolactonase (cycloisomerase 2 family)
MTDLSNRSQLRKSFVLFTAGLSTALSACGGGGGTTAVPMAELAYEGDGFVYLAGVMAPTLEPVTGPAGDVAYSVEPALPAGLTLDPTGGGITGEPQAATPLTVYRISAQSESGTAVAELELEVRDRFETPRFAFSLDWDSAHVNSWRVDAETGELELASRAASDLFPFRAVSDPLGRHLYVSHFGTGTIGTYEIDALDGSLNLKQLLPVGSAAFELVMSPNGRFLVAADVGSDLIASFAIDADGGTLVPNAGLVAFADPSGLTINNSGDRLFAASLSQNRIASFALDRMSGMLLAELSSEQTPGPVGLALTPSEDGLFTANSSHDALTSFSVDLQSGEITRLGSVFSGEEPLALSVDQDGQRLSVANLGGRRIESFAIGSDLSLALIDSIDLPGAATALVELKVDEALLTPLFDERMVSSTLPGDAAGHFVNGPARSNPGRPSDLTVVFAARGMSLEPESVYTSNLGSADLSELRFDATSQRLDPAGAPLPLGGSPAGIVLSGDRTSLLVADSVAQAVLELELGAAGELPNVPAAGLALGGDVAALATCPTGGAIYAAGPGLLMRLTVEADGSLSVAALEPAGTNPESLAVSPDGRFVYVTDSANGELSIFSTVAGGLSELPTPVFDAVLGQGPCTVAISPDGGLLALSNADLDTLRTFAIDRADGSVTYLQDLSVEGSPRDLAWSLDGRRLYVALNSDSSIATVERKDNDLLVLRGTAIVGQGPVALHLDPSGQHVYAAAADSSTVDVLEIVESGTLVLIDSVSLGAGAQPTDLVSRPVWRELSATPMP